MSFCFKRFPLTEFTGECDNGFMPSITQNPKETPLNSVVILTLSPRISSISLSRICIIVTYG